MNQRNSSEAPSDPIETPPTRYVDAPRVASGQKMVILAFVVYLGAGALRSMLGPATGILVLVAFAMGLIGAVQVMGGLAWSTATKVISVILLFVPLANLITLLVVNSKASSALRNAGYHVRFFGASRY